MNNTLPDWSSLPEPLISMIGKRLPTRIDTPRFRAVCKSFRSSVPSPISSVSGIHYDDIPTLSRIPSQRLVIAESTIHAIEPISGISNTQQTRTIWLLNVEESPSGKVRILDPFINFHFKQVSRMLPESLNLLDYRVKEISKGYRVVRVDYPTLVGVFFEEVAVSTDNDEEFAIMVFTRSKVVLWRRVDNKWTDINIDHRHFPFISKLIYHKKRFFVLGSNGSGLTVDAKFLKVTEAVAPPSTMSSMLLSNHLVKSSVDLFLIQKFYYDQPLNTYSKFATKSDGRCWPVGMSIYKLDEEKKEWIEVKDGFKDRALFLCRDGNFFLSAEEFSGCKWNCVYLADRSPTYHRHDYPGKNTVILNLENHTTERLSAFPGYSEIFWPPPAWLFS